MKVKLEKLLFNIKNRFFSKKSRPILLGLAFFCLIYVNLKAQNAYSTGTEFLFSYGDIIKNSGYWKSFGDTNSLVTVFIAAPNDACGNVEVLGGNFSQPFVLKPDSIVEISLPYSSNYPFETKITRAIKVTSNTPVAVVMAINPHGGTDTIHAFHGYPSLTETSAQIPKKNAATVAIAHSTISPLASNFSGQTPGTFISLISYENSNQIQFKLNVTGLDGTGSVPATPIRYKDSVYTISLQAGEQLNFSTFSSSLDPGGKGYYNGSYFTSLNNKLLSINVIPNSGYCLDAIGIEGPWAPLQEQPLPLPFYGTHFHGLPLAGFIKNSYSILTSKKNTEVVLNGVVVANLDSLGFLDTCFAGSAVISTTHPVSIFMAGCPTRKNDITFSQSTVTLSGDHQLQTRSVFATIDEPDTLNNYVVGLVMPSVGINQFTLNGATLNSNLFTPFTSDSTWSWANIPVKKGHYIAESPVGFHGILSTWYSDSIDFWGGPPLYPGYSYVLPECVPWPLDSFVHRAGLSPNILEPFSAFVAPMCPGQPVFFQPNHLRHTTWLWDFGDGTTFTQRVKNERAGTISHTFNQLGNFWVTVTDSAGCAPPDSVLIKIENGVVADFTATTTTSCSSTFVQLQNQSTGATDYWWQWPGSSSSVQSPSFNFQGADTAITITLVASNQNCADTITQTFNIEPSAFNPAVVPNVISPNNDGINDAFCMEEAAGFSDCFQLQIFNRWGSEVFKTQNPQDCWLAENAAAGVYFYMLIIGQQNYTGEITVFK